MFESEFRTLSTFNRASTWRQVEADHSEDWHNDVRRASRCMYHRFPNGCTCVCHLRSSWSPASKRLRAASASSRKGVGSIPAAWRAARISRIGRAQQFLLGRNSAAAARNTARSTASAVSLSPIRAPFWGSFDTRSHQKRCVLFIPKNRLVP